MYFNTVNVSLPFHRRVETMLKVSRLHSALAALGWKPMDHTIFNINEFQQQGTLFFR